MAGEGGKQRGGGVRVTDQASLHPPDELRGLIAARTSWSDREVTQSAASPQDTRRRIQVVSGAHAFRFDVFRHVADLGK